MEPERWLNAHENPAIVRALRAGTEVAPPRGAEDSAWSALAAALATGGAVTVAAGTASGISAAILKPSSLSFVALSKLFGISFGIGVLVTGGGALVTRSFSNVQQHHDAPHVTAPSPVVPATTLMLAPRAGDQRTSVSDSPPVTATPTNASPLATAASNGHATPLLVPAPELPVAAPVAAPSASASGPSEESRVVLAAREALRTGNPERALADLEHADAVFGTSGLAQERLALEIDACVAAGRRKQAKQRAAFFVARYPESPHSARFRALR